MFVIKFIVFWSAILLTIDPNWAYEFSAKELEKLRNETKEMFYHAYNGYLDHAYPYDELQPLTCTGVNTWGSFSLTLIDALDTLAVFGNFSEFRRVSLILENLDFNMNVNVSVFESNIRVVGGLLSAHLLSEKAGVELEEGWPCDGPLLRLAVDLADRLLPAFDTPTGMPYGTVNLKYGVDNKETPETCTAGVGTYIIEFATLSRLTGDMRYENTALRAMNSLSSAKSKIGLVGNHINVVTGKWTAMDSGVGAGLDSYLEYLVKGSILLDMPELMQTFKDYLGPIDKYVKQGDWYMWVNMNSGQVTMPIHQSLDAFWPGLQTLYGDTASGYKTILNYIPVWKKYGGTPEFYSITHNAPISNREGYPLRPELIESVMYLYRSTKDPLLLEFGKSLMFAIDKIAKTSCGFATVKDVRDHTLENRMESFFLAETIKYLYLLFDPDNYLLTTMKGASIRKFSDGRECILGAGGYVLNTEAHPIDVSALKCCDAMRRETEKNNLGKIFETLTLSDITTLLPIDNEIKTGDRDNIEISDSDNNNTSVKYLMKCNARFDYSKLSKYGNIFGD